MSFGNEAAQQISGGNTLSGFIASKMVQTRKEAKKVDKKENNTAQKKKQNSKQDQRQPPIFKLDKLIGKISSLGDIFSKNKKTQKKTKISRPSGNSAGLSKILSNGFGSLSVDTSRISGGLSVITQVLNKSLQTQTFTATGIKNIVGILSGQLQSQSSLLSTVKSLRRGGGDAGGKPKFGNNKAGSKAGGDTLTEYLIKKAAEKGLGKFLGRTAQSVTQRFFPKSTPSAAPKVATEGAEAIAKKKLAQEITQRGLSSKGTMIGGKYVSMTAAEAAQSLAPKAAQGPLAGLSKMIGGFGSKILPKGAQSVGAKALLPRLLPGAQTAFGIGFAGKELSEGDIGGAALAGGSAIPGVGYGFLAADIGRELMGADVFDKMMGQAYSGETGFSDKEIEKRHKTMSATERAMTSMPMPFSKGGVMLGEAGKEAVVDLNSNQGKNLLGNQQGDIGMKTSGASTLAIVDQFIKGMGPLGAPVSQALGPDIQNLSKTFGMSQVLPNLKLGGGKFNTANDSKKNRDKFLESLISGSLEALGAKKEDDKKTEEKPPKPPPDPGPVGDPNSPANPAAPATPTPTGSGADRPMDDHRRPTATSSSFTPNLTGTSFNPMVGAGGKLKSNNQIHLEVPGFNGKYEVLSNRADGKFQVWEKGLWGIIGNKPKLVGTGKDNTTGKYKDPLFAASYNEVRANYRNQAVETGVRFGYITPTEYNAKQDKINAARVNGDQQRGGIVKESYQKGGQKVEKPWWDFLGLVTGAKEVKKGTTGIYSNSPMGKIGEAAAQRNKMMEDMGYEKGGTPKFGVESDKEKTIEYRVKVLEEMLLATAAAITQPSTQQVNTTANSNSRKFSTPSSAPVLTTNQPSEDSMSSATIINLVGAGATQQIQEAGYGQSTDDYVRDPWPSGLAGVLCNSPWGV